VKKRVFKIQVGDTMFGRCLLLEKKHNMGIDIEYFFHNLKKSLKVPPGMLRK
jgi:hypothetical protein